MTKVIFSPKAIVLILYKKADPVGLQRRYFFYIEGFETGAVKPAEAAMSSYPQKAVVVKSERMNFILGKPVVVVVVLYAVLVLGKSTEI